MFFGQREQSEHLNLGPGKLWHIFYNVCTYILKVIISCCWYDAKEIHIYNLDLNLCLKTILELQYWATKRLITISPVSVKVQCGCLTWLCHSWTNRREEQHKYPGWDERQMPKCSSCHVLIFRFFAGLFMVFCFAEVVPCICSEFLSFAGTWTVGVPLSGKITSSKCNFSVLFQATDSLRTQREQRTNEKTLFDSRHST